MNINHSSFLAGIEKKADELFLTRSIKEFILEKAALFKTTDTADDISNTPGAMDSEAGAALALLARSYPDLLAGAGIGGAGGAGLASLLSKGKNTKGKNMLLGGGLGAGIGAGTAGLNYLNQVADNSTNL